MLVGMLLLAGSFLVFTFIGPTTGVLLAIAGFVIHSVGQAFAYNISTTAAMEAVTEQKSGEASGVISTIRMIAIVFGVAVTGVLFKTLEKVKIFDLFTQAGRSLTAAERSEVHGLLSGSVDAQTRLAALKPEAAHQVEAIVRGAFVYGLKSAMILCLAMSLLGALSALQLRRET
jgi:hypothetical protein